MAIRIGNKTRKKGTWGRSTLSLQPRKASSTQSSSNREVQGGCVVYILVALAGLGSISCMVF